MALNGSVLNWVVPCRLVLMPRPAHEVMEEAIVGMRAAFRIGGAPVLPAARPVTFHDVAVVNDEVPPPPRSRIGFVLDCR